MRDDNSRLLLLHALCHANKHCNQFVGFSLQRSKSVGGKNFCFRKQLVPTFPTLVPACLRLALLWFWAEPHRV